MIKKITVLLLGITLVFPLFSACTKKPSGDNTPSAEVEFWSTYATEKILQDRTDGYDLIKKDAVVDVEACRGEYESTQIIMTAKDDVSAYNVQISDLTSSGGEKFSKDNISVRHQKYIHVREVFSSNGAQPGWYPDALVPLENIVERKENTIKKDQNQGLYITFNVPVGQTAGDYLGSIKVTYDGKEKVLPVNLTVFDYTVSEETNSMSYFNLGFTLYFGELDSTYDMWRKYAETLTEYRISPSLVMDFPGASDEQIIRYVDEAVDFVKNFGMSTINMPIKEGSGLTKYIVALAERSIEDNYNYVEKILVKGPDEPDLTGMAILNSYNNNFRAGRSASVTEIGKLKQKYPSASEEFINQLMYDAGKIPSIITMYNGRSEASDATNVDTYCPTANQYDTQEGRDKYEEYGSTREKWWYTCINPRPPYPSYHTEDNLVSARALNWMMIDYDVVGNLYWATTVYSKNNGKVYLPLEDLYESDADRWPRVNGDGYLFYPGAQYGIYGPVASMRMEAIRDGNEDYEILLDLKNTYDGLGFSSSNVLSYLTHNIYQGTQVLSNEVISPRFADARKSAIQLAMLAKSSAGLCVTDVFDDNKGTVTFELIAKTGFEVKNHGVVLTSQNGAPEGFNKYILEIKSDKARNTLALSVEADEKEYRLDMNLGGMSKHFSADELLNSENVFSGGKAVETEISEGNLVFDISSTMSGHQFIRYTSKIFNDFDATTEKIVLHFAEGSSPTFFRILVKPSNSMINEEIIFANLPSGESRLTIDLSMYWARYGKIEYADIYFSANDAAHPTKTVKIEGITVYSIEGGQG